VKQQKIVLYCRFATKEQLCIQKERLREYARNHNCEVVAEIDDRCSLKRFRRWRLRRVIRVASKHEANIAVVNVSRIAREFPNITWFNQKLSKQNLSLLSTAEGKVDDPSCLAGQAFS
jgi:DNA invertase Pin-like site-specific DNA recombinase